MMAAKPWEELITCVDVRGRKQLRICRNCGERCGGRRTVYCSDACDNAFRDQHFWTAASAVALRRAHHSCEREGCTERLRLEVNHIEPLRGGPRSFTCLNHASNLEVLCHSHHLIETERQFRPGKAAARAALASL